MKTIAEQLAAFEAKKAELQTRAAAIVAKSLEEERTLDEAEQEEHAAAAAEVQSIDKHCAMLKQHEALMINKATPVTPDTGRGQGAVSIQGSGPVSVKRNLPPGTAFTRYVSILAHSKGNLMQAEVLSRDARFSDTPELNAVMKAAVAAGTTSDSTWAGPLVQYQDMVGEFIELLRPRTILGRMDAVRRVPFNIRIPRQTAGSSGTFVGEGAPTPVSKADFDSVLLPWAKASTIMVITTELARLSNPSAEMLVRDDMLAGMSAFLDKRLVDPAYPGVTSVSPASLTNGVTPRQASGATLAAIDDDVKYIQDVMADADLPLDSLVWVMSSNQANRLNKIRTNQDTKAYPEISINGGTFEGIPVIVSNNVAPSGSPGDQHMLLINQREVLLADDGQMTIDVSSEASLQMDGAPAAGAQSLTSLWQNGQIGFKVDRWIYWTKRRSQAVQFIDGAQRYGS